MFSCNDLELIQVIIYLSKGSVTGSRCNSFSVPLPFLLKDFFRKPPGDSESNSLLSNFDATISRNSTPRWGRWWLLITLHQVFRGWTKSLNHSRDPHVPNEIKVYGFFMLEILDGSDFFGGWYVLGCMRMFHCAILDSSRVFARTRC